MKGLEQIGSRAFFRPTGTFSVQEAVAMSRAAIRAARRLGVVDLLIDGTGANGFGPTNAFERYDFGTAWAEAAGPDFCVAIVLRPEMIDRQKLGVLVAQNRNAVAEVFSNEVEALTWLDARLRPHRSRRSPNHVG